MQAADAIAQVLFTTPWGTTTVNGLSAGATVRSLKEHLKLKLRMRYGDVYLMHNCRRLEEERTLVESGILSGSTIHLCMRMRGGARAGVGEGPSCSGAAGAGTSTAGEAMTSDDEVCTSTSTLNHPRVVNPTP